MHKPKILLVEDDDSIAALIKLQAELSGYKVVVKRDGIQGLSAIKRENPEIVILDILIPGMNGLDVCRKVKNTHELKHIPIILLSTTSEELDIILGLELGADDYVTKPFSPKVLFSRVKAILRRKSEPALAPQSFSFGIFHMNFEAHIIKKKDTPISLTLSEFGILRRLISNRGKVLTRNQLLDDLQNDDAFVVDRNIDVHIAALRKKLGPKFTYIETVRGLGYRFRNDED